MRGGGNAKARRESALLPCPAHLAVADVARAAKVNIRNTVAAHSDQNPLCNARISW